MPQLVADTFARSNQSGWGTSSSGHTWAQIDGTDTLAVSSNEGTATGSVNTNSMRLGSTLRTATDVEGIVTTQMSATNAKTGIELRIQDANNYYACRLNGANNKLELCLQSAGVLSVLANASFTVAAATNYKIRFRTQGTTIEGKVWAASGSEPGGWTVTTTDSTISTAGNVGLYTLAGATGTTIQFDHFTATNLQDTLDLVMRARFLAATATIDLHMRAGVTVTVNKNLTMRARIFASTSTLDLGMRARVYGFGQKDLAMRATLAEAVNALPTWLANSFTVKVGGYANLTILEGSYAYSEMIDGRHVCSFAIRDDSGTLHLQHRQPVEVTHAVRGIVFTGFVNSAQESNLPPNATNILSVTCIDEHYLADKRAYEGEEFVNEYAGDIAVSLAAELASEGVTAAYALDRDTSTSDFAQGTLSGVVATSNVGSSSGGDGDLELSPAGQTVTIRENTQQAFALGILNNVVATNTGTLQLASTQAIKLVGTSAANVGSSLYTYVKIWNGSYVVQASDYIVYDVWISSTSPKIMGGADVVCTDGTTLRDSPGLDQNQIAVHPKTDLTGFANDQWYSRKIGMPSQLVGKTLSYASIASEGDTSGTYTIYVRHFKLFDSSNNLKVTFFESSIQTNQQLQNLGYYNVSASQVLAYEQSGNRLSSNYDLSPAGIVRTSLISWTETIPTQPTGGAQNNTLPILIETSWDALASWQQMTNNTPIASLLAGTSLTGKVLLIRETLTINGPSPEVTPVLSAVQATIRPSYACNKTDVRESNTIQVALNQGTLTNLSTVPGIGNQISGWKRDWNNGDLSNQTLYGDQTSPPAQSIWYHALQLRVSTGFDVRARLDFAGQWQDFVAEFDTQFPDTDSANYGIIYRTTGWQNNNDTYAYSAFLSNTGVAIGKGTNSSVGAGSFTSLGSASVTFTAGNWYHVKLVVAGTSHKLYVNDVLYVSITDATYTATGYLGLRHYYNGASGRHSGYFDNFGIMTSAFVGTRVHQPLDLTACGSVTNSIIQWNATVPPNCTFLVEASLDNGAHYTTCINGAAIPGLVSGINTVGVSLLVRETYSTNNANTTPTLTGITSYVVGQFQSVGYRVSPPLSLSPVGRVGSSLVSWNATLASDNTLLGVDVSPDNSTWTDVTASNGGTIPFINSQAVPYVDNFAIDQSTLYTSSFVTGGASATWTVDTPNSRIVASGGANGFFSPTGQILGDGEIIFDTDYADFGGVFWRISSDHGSCYGLAVQDSAAPRTPNVMRLFKIVNGTTSQIGLGSALSFTRGTPTRFKIVQTGGNITITTDYPVLTPDGALVGGNTQTITYTDPSPLQAGSVALRSNGGTNRYSLLRFTQYGDDVTNKSLYTRLRLSTTDPLYTPQVQDLNVSVRSNTIDTGALIPSTTYSTLSGSTNTMAQNCDDLASQSSYWWRILQRVFYFQSRTAIPAPFVVTGLDMLYNATVNVNYSSDLYRNEQIIIGGIDVLPRSETRVADGIRSGFDTTNQIDSVTSILVNGQLQSFGIQGIDSGKQWYYQQGQIGITQDASGTPLADGTEVEIDYEGQVQVIAKARNEGQIALLAAIDGTSGVVTIVENASGLNSAAAQALAQSRLQQYSIIDSIDISFTTCRPGLHIGQLLTVFLSQHQLINKTFLITQVNYSESMVTANGLQTLYERFAVQATSGPIVTDWTLR